MAVVGSLLWPSFLLLDLVVDSFIQPARSPAASRMPVTAEPSLG